MKNRVVTAIIVLFFTAFAVILYAGADKAQVKQTKVEITKLTDQYGEKLLEAFYSIDELRPTAIFQLDKTIMMYKNAWIPPQKMLKAISEDEKEEMLNGMIQHIAGLKPEAKNKVMTKINFWLVDEMQFRILTDGMQVSEEALLKAIYANDKTAFLFGDLSVSGVQKNVSDLNILQKNKAYYDALNVVSALPVNEQMKYFSLVMSDLSNLAMK